jgi:sigma-B regulation protein RsbU (phosphoserine phosphatase)
LTPVPTPRSPELPKRLGCGETWSGNRSTSSLVILPGLEAWVHAVPAGIGDAGGDVHYLSSCPQCIVSRVALADVSGHGEEVAAIGEKLRQLMLRYLSALEQVGLMRDLNRVARSALGSVHYATLLAIGWHATNGLLVVTNAGHPPPMWYQAAQREWSWLETDRAHAKGKAAGVPLGLLEEVTYDRKVVKLRPGDLVVLYSDGLSEATNQADAELGRDGLMEIARGLGSHSAEVFGNQLAASVLAFRQGVAPADDQTLIVLRSSGPEW